MLDDEMIVRELPSQTAKGLLTLRVDQPDPDAVIDGDEIVLDLIHRRTGPDQVVYVSSVALSQETAKKLVESLQAAIAKRKLE